MLYRNGNPAMQGFLKWCLNTPRECPQGTWR